MKVRASTNARLREVWLVVGCICFLIAILADAGIVNVAKADWQDVGLFFGFLAFLFK